MKVSSAIKHLILSALILPTHTAMAKNPSSSIIVKGVGDEMVLFYKPTKMQKSKSSDAESDMLIDFTFTSHNDSLTINSTHVSKSPLRIDSVTISAGNCISSHPLKAIYVEPEGHKWKSRLSFSLSLSEFKRLASFEAPPVFSFMKDYSFLYSDSRQSWENRKDVFNLMLEIINLNYE